MYGDVSVPYSLLIYIYTYLTAFYTYTQRKVLCVLVVTTNSSRAPRDLSPDSDLTWAGVTAELEENTKFRSVARSDTRHEQDLPWGSV